MTEPAPSFVRVPSLTAFLGERARRVVVHRTFAYWQVGRDALGAIVWGRPDERDVLEMCAAHAVRENPLFLGHGSLLDVRALESIDLFAFQKLLAYLARRRRERSTVSREVVLHGGGYAQAVALGMCSLVRPAHPLVFESDPVTAFASVGAAHVREELEALRLELCGAPALVRNLEVVLEELGPRTQIADIARRLGMSVRSLQRGLALCGTTLGREQQRHVVRAAERLLELTDLALEAIAAQVGVSSASYLVTLFRRHRGMTPGELRARRRHLSLDAINTRTG